MTQHTYNLVLTCTAIMAVAIVGCVRKDVDAQLVLLVIGALAGVVSLGTASINGWRNGKAKKKNGAPDA